MKQNAETQQGQLLETLEQRTAQLRRESKEATFDAYLQLTTKQLEEHRHRLETLSLDVERNYEIYRKRMQQAERPAVSVSGLLAKEPKTSAQGESVSTEYKIGVGIFGVVGVLFMVAAFMMFGISYLQGNAGFFITTGTVFLVNIVLFLIPKKRGRQVAGLMQLTGNTVITWILAMMTVAKGIEGGLILFYVISAVVVANLLFRQLKKDAISTTLFAVCISSLGILYLFLNSSEKGNMAAFGILVLVCICFFMLEQGSGFQWIQYWYLCLMIPAYAAFGFGDTKSRYSLPLLVGILGVFTITKLFSRVKLLRISELVITVATALFGLWYYTGPYGIYVLAAFMLSAFALYRDKMFYQIVITLMGIAYFACHPFLIELTEGIAHYEIFLAGTISVLLVCMLLFNLVKPWCAKGVTVYNYCCLSCMGLLYLTAFLCTNNIVYSILTLAGMITIIVTFRERFGIRTSHRTLFLLLFLVYMVFLLRIQTPFGTSILLMGIAAFGIVAGFLARKKDSRIFGLTLSVFVCLKVICYDFIELAIKERILLFLIVGMIALGIALIYIVLEKRIAKTQG